MKWRNVSLWRYVDPGRLRIVWINCISQFVSEAIRHINNTNTSHTQTQRAVGDCRVTWKEWEIEQCTASKFVRTWTLFVSAFTSIRSEHTCTPVSHSRYCRSSAVRLVVCCGSGKLGLTVIIVCHQNKIRLHLIRVESSEVGEAIYSRALSVYTYAARVFFLTLNGRQSCDQWALCWILTRVCHLNSAACRTDEPGRSVCAAPSRL